MFLPAFARRDPAHHFGPIRDGLLRMERSLFAGKTLHQQARLLIHQYAHLPAAFTTFSAASRIPSAMVKFNPESINIFRPNSTLVPSMRTTMGTLTLSSL